MDYTNITLGSLLSSDNSIIKRNAMSILKQLQSMRDELQEAQTAKEREEIAKHIAKNDYDKQCSICSAPIYGSVQVHHHNEKCKLCGYEMIGTQQHDCTKVKTPVDAITDDCILTHDHRANNGHDCQYKDKPVAKVRMCDFCHVKPATLKDFREVDETTGSYRVCERCFNLETKEVIRIDRKWTLKNN